jgi:hypothetical protein
MIRLWTHEALRVFHDRLTDDQDRVWLGKLLCEMLEAHFKETGSKVFGMGRVTSDSLVVGMRGLLFGDFMVPGADPKLYKCVLLLEHAHLVLALDINANCAVRLDSMRGMLAFSCSCIALILHPSADSSMTRIA